MDLSGKFLEKLVCPNCKSSLEYDQPNEKLICRSCQVSYKVENNVPVLLADESEKI